MPPEVSLGEWVLRDVAVFWDLCANPIAMPNVIRPIPIMILSRWSIVRRLVLVLLAAGPCYVQATVLEPPSLRCTAVAANGEVTLTWVVPPDPTNEFQQYEVFRADAAAGPFMFVAAVSVYAQTTFMDAGTNGNLGSRFYYLTTISNNGTPNNSVPSDTLATLFIQVSQSVPLGNSVVDWNLQHVPPLATSDLNALVDMEYPLGTWSLADTVLNTLHHWSQVVSICDDSLNFRVYQPDASGCYTTSNATGARFQDITPPSIPIMVTVTVDTATNQSVLNWNPSPELDTQGYIVVQSTPGGNVIIDTVYGRLNTMYPWSGSLAGSGPESFTIAALDSCSRGNPPSPNTSATFDPHTTIFLSTDYDRCAGTITVNRTPYVGWPVEQYSLFGSIDNAPYTLVATLGPDDPPYALADAQADRTYCFVMQAIGAQPEQVSLSNKNCRTTAYPQVPQWNYLRVATVTAKDHITVVDSVDLSSFTKRFVLERTYNGGPWEPIAEAPGGAIPLLVFEDFDVLTDERSYSYRVAAEDSCGARTAISNLGTTILLSASADLDGYNRLYWNGYSQWAGNVAGYTVYRSIADGPFDPVGSTAASNWQFPDNVENLFNTPGKFCYYVEANETGDPSGINAVSLSNIACAVQQEEVWVPNAFIAGGYNSTFKPVLAYADINRYEFTIFNRWGQQIWTTTNRDEAWDGRVNGAFVPQGVYAYYCSFLNGAGKTVERKGTVTFLP